MLILSSLGGALEFYDFVVYGTFAQYIGNAFFPVQDKLVRLILAFAVFAVGYVARPVGGVILSHFGDKYGRRRVFIASILTMSSATVCIGLLPTYARWGLAAPFAMVLLRLVQGFSLGGELPGAITYVVETAPRKAGFAAGFIFFCVNTGVALASAIFWAVQLLPPQQGDAWGWRIAFLFGGCAGLLSFYLRLSLEETAEFKKMRHAVARRPFVELMRSSRGAVLVGIAAMTATAGFNGLLFAMPALLPTHMHYTKASVGAAQNIGLLVLSFGLLATAWLGDRIPRQWLLRVGAVLLGALCIPFFTAAADHSVGLIPLFIGAGLAASFVNGPMCGIVGDLFPTRIRFSGIAVSFNLAFSIFSGTAPLIAASLIKVTGSPVSAAYIMLACAIITFIGSLFVRHYDGHILSEQRAAAAALASAPSFPAQ